MNKTKIKPELTEQLRRLKHYHYVLAALNIPIVIAIIFAWFILQDKSLPPGTCATPLFASTVFFAGILLPSAFAYSILLVYAGKQIAKNRELEPVMAISILGLLFFPLGTVLAACTISALKKQIE